MTAWTSGFLTPGEADETVRLAKEANLNALFIQVRKVGDAYYNSCYEPRASNITGASDYDPLAYIIEKAHAAGIEVHAWINTFRVWKSDGVPTDPNHIVLLHPDWLTRTACGDRRADEGLYLDPGVPEVQDYTFNVFMDVVKNYDVDGIHFDYVRYPGPAFGYAPEAVVQFNQETSRAGTPANDDSLWQQWRRDQVTSLVRRIYKEAILIKPNIKITAATVPWGDCADNFCKTAPYNRVYQDWRRWMEEGILDANIPMNYKDEGNAKNAREYRNWLSGFKRWRYDRHLYCGLDFNQSPDMVIQQLKAAEKRGVEGMVGFSFNQTDSRKKLVQSLRSGIYSYPAVVPEMPWKMDAVRRASRDRYAKAIDAATRGQDVDGAIALLHEAVRLDPKYADAHFRLGRCYLKKDMYDDAINEFKVVLTINPDYVSAKHQIEIAEGEMDKGELAVPCPVLR